jgi:hypothetical protein
MAKFGERFVDDMIDRGRRELASVMFADSNVAQALYPLPGGVEAQAPAFDESGPTLAERLEAPVPEFKGPELDEPERGIERD